KNLSQNEVHSDPDLILYNPSVLIDKEPEYIHLLRDTASMTTEDLAKKHLNVDLTQPDFWQAGIDMVTEDIQTFMELTEEFI
ncbi:TPA: hypothetical protein PW014_002182, partial [Enterococcus faecium]|nr:hypothetical protein [Enterococcus faecium]